MTNLISHIVALLFAARHGGLLSSKSHRFKRFRKLPHDFCPAEITRKGGTRIFARKATYAYYIVDFGYICMNSAVTWWEHLASQIDEEDTRAPAP